MLLSSLFIIPEYLMLYHLCQRDKLLTESFFSLDFKEVDPFLLEELLKLNNDPLDSDSDGLFS